jgi:hypothetical protein
MTVLSPTVTGTVSTYSVAPALPAGLSLNTSTGSISGTPTAVAAAGTYTVTAANATGNTSTTLSLTVNDAVPQISYAAPAFVFTKGVAITALTPTVTGGTVLTWSIAPALPAGLTFNTSNGTISGTPTAWNAVQGYRVTATNSGGNATADMNISVQGASQVALELGHVSNISIVRATSSRLLAHDGDGRWTLSDSQTTALKAKGQSCASASGHLCTSDLAGTTLAIEVTTGFEMRSATDGHVLANIANASPSSWWKLAPDGTYLVAGDATGMEAWSPSGTQLFSRAGDYSKGVAFAAPTEVRVAAGAAGANVVETVAVSSGASSVGPAFNGTFQAWFGDGERFLTNVSTTVFVYSKSGIQQDIASLPTTGGLGGLGDWYWTADLVNLRIYAVGASSSPAATYALGTLTSIAPSGSTIGLISYGDPQIRFVDLSGASPTVTTHSTPVPDVSAFVMVSPTQWFGANSQGVTFDGSSAEAGTPKYFSLGNAWSIAGGMGHFAVATASGSVFYFKSSSLEQEGELKFPSSKIVMSTDGAVLGAQATTRYAQYYTDRTLKVFSIPSGAEMLSLPYSYGLTNQPYDIALSGNGQVFAKSIMTSSNMLTRDAMPSSGGGIIWSDSIASSFSSVPDIGIPIRLSPDGTLIAVSDKGLRQLNTGTNIYKNGTLTTAVPGWAVGWVDDNRLIVSKYVSDGSPKGNPVWNGVDIVDAGGHVVASPAITELLGIQTVGANSIYSPMLNSILSVQNGDTLWSSATKSTGGVGGAGMGAVAGNYVIFQTGTTVLAEQY